VPKDRPGKGRLNWLIRRLRHADPYLGGPLTAAAFLGFALALPDRTGQWSASAILLMAVLISSSLWGLRQGLISSFIAAIAYDFFFLPPLYSLRIDDWAHVVSLALLGLTAVTISILAEAFTRNGRAARRHEIITRRVYTLGRYLGEANDPAEIAKMLVTGVGTVLGAKAVLLERKVDGPMVAAAHPKGASLTPSEWETVLRLLQGNKGAIQHTAGSHSDCTAVLINEAESTVVLAIGQTRRRLWQLPERMHVIETLAGGASAAFKRVALHKRAEDARLAAEAERLRSALLTSLSHELKTPLAVILGSASSLMELKANLSAGAAEELLGSILEEGERLNQQIANLLDMSRVESEGIRPERQPSDLGDIIGSALDRAKRALSYHYVAVEVPDDIPNVDVDPILMEKAIFNILENAAKYTPPGTTVTLSASHHQGPVILMVGDEGSGIQPKDLPHLFEKFYRGGDGKRKPWGTGLGLAISRGFLQAMGATITASNRHDRSGALFAIELQASESRAGGKEALGNTSYVQSAL
jgi:two-component system sensor histidine kinase KdpD